MRTRRWSIAVAVAMLAAFWSPGVALAQPPLSISPDPPPGSGGPVTVASTGCPNNTVVVRLVLDDTQVLQTHSIATGPAGTWSAVVTFPPASTLSSDDFLVVEAACGTSFDYDGVEFDPVGGGGHGSAHGHGHSHGDGGHGHAAHAVVASPNQAG